MREILRQLQQAEARAQEQNTQITREHSVTRNNSCSCCDPYCVTCSSGGGGEYEARVEEEREFDMTGYLLAVARIMQDFQRSHPHESETLPSFSLLLNTIQHVGQGLQQISRFNQERRDASGESYRLANDRVFGYFRGSSRRNELDRQASRAHDGASRIWDTIDPDQTYRETRDYFTQTLCRL